MTASEGLPVATFSTWDKNGDGKVDRTEWIEKMTSYVDDISSAELDSLWNEFDTDESKYLNQDQFVEMIVEVMKRYGLDIQIKLVWAHFDRDEDGLLQADEFNNFIHRFGLGEEEEEIVVSMRLIQNLTLESDILKREIFSTYTPAGEPVNYRCFYEVLSELLQS